MPVRTAGLRVGSDGARVMGILIVKIVVIKVVQRIYVRDPRIRDVHVAEIISAGVIPRTERFAESQREPADSTAPAATETKAEPTAAHKTDERWSVKRLCIHGPMATAPTAASTHPSSI